MIAFDYKQQKWVMGEEAVKLRRIQLQEELALLNGEEGPAYARMMGIAMTVALDHLNEEMRRLGP